MNFVPTLSRPQKILSGLICVVAFIFQTPAHMIRYVLPADIGLQDISGSFWNGKIGAIGLDGLIVQEKVEWNFQPNALLAGALAWDIRGHFGEHASHLQLRIGPAYVEANNVNLMLPLEPVAAMLPRLKSIPLGGQMTVEATRLRSAQAPTATVHMRHVFSPLAGPIELGNYRLEITGGGSSVQWRLATPSGDLHVTGEGSLEKEGVPHGQLTIEPKFSIPHVSALVASLTKKEGSQYQLSF